MDPEIQILMKRYGRMSLNKPRKTTAGTCPNKPRSKLSQRVQIAIMPVGPSVNRLCQLPRQRINLDDDLPTPRPSTPEPVGDNGDSLSQPHVTKEQLDQELEQMVAQRTICLATDQPCMCRS